MKALLAAAAAASLVITPALAEGMKQTPGHEMQEHGSKAGSPGASGYAPGHEMKAGRSDSDDMTGGKSGGMRSGDTDSMRGGGKMRGGDRD